MLDHKAWLAKALGDLRSAKKLAKDDDDTLDTSAYHTQQCAEKALKAYLVFKNQAVPRTHDLEKLLELCASLEPSCKILLSDALDLLPYAIYSRYPDDRFDVSRVEVLSAIKKAAKILNFVKNLIEPEKALNKTIFNQN
ncbi:MAG TPA: HEPN domain-containing protein [Candidatus Babeliales bacterium]|nr:HEPN domain-containing protein [Candidatus Babeliales bacterium]